MVQIQPAEHFAEALFLGPFEPMPLKDGLRTVLLPCLTNRVGVTPHQISVPFPSHRGKGLRLLAFPGLMFDPGILFLRLVRWRFGTPLTFWQLRGQAIQHVGPLVVTDAPTVKAGRLNPVEILASARTTVGVKVVGFAFPARLVLLE